MSDMIMQMLPLMVLQAVFAVMMFNLAKRLGARAWAWATVCLIPVFGSFAIMFLPVRALFILADRTNRSPPAAE